MSSPRRELLEKASNVAVVIVAAVSLLMLARSIRHPAPSSPSLPVAADFVGKRIDLSRIAKVPAKTNVILALSTHCHFCSQNAQFYRALSKMRRSGSVGLFAVLPENSTEVTEYLREKSIDVDNASSLPLDTYRVESTPTILIADENGMVRKAWIGALDGTGQKQVLDAIRPN